ncbi:MAG TPA: exo-alpha-sialidase [Phycisphaerae bacterium]|nr:exo-alpha-sialidase [Phycisphaerae bacterium]HRY67582.1 exo-alpha-sialidase [Phycisphaerae bacterium]HSA24969.1 exo-alpha-sialidase [Phycisphaerae bacterium]
MKPARRWMTACLLLPAGCSLGQDPRDIRHGSPIPDEGYCDQPYVIVTREGHWLCVLTTGKGEEGQGGQHVVSTISTNHGSSWSKLTDIEPADGPDASWATPLITPTGRVYVFYDYNGDRVGPQTLGGKKINRFDMLGWYAFKYSDDGGRTWSRERHRLPVRLTHCDRTNDWKGKVQILWGIDKPDTCGHSAFFAFTKLGAYLLDQGEGWLFRSDNILTEPDPNRIEWLMLPEGEQGIRAPEFGSVQEEHNIVPLANGDLYCIYRTTTGRAVHTYSRDRGLTWSKPEIATYTPGGQPVKQPRACPRLFRARNGNYLLWFHNHGGRDFLDRNPAWICGGIEREGHLLWSQPEILLYDREPTTRISYPDLIEQDGRYWITETQKTTARVHEIDPTLLHGVWNQQNNRQVARKGLVLDLDLSAKNQTQVHIPPLPNLATGGGFTLDLTLKLNRITPGQIILETKTRHGRGLTLVTGPDATVRIEMCDGHHSAAGESDPGSLIPGKDHHLTAIVDGGPKIITFVVDGRLCDGGPTRRSGWSRFPPELNNVNGTQTLRLATSLDGQLSGLRVYDRYLRTSEAVANALSFNTRAAGADKH